MAVTRDYKRAVIRRYKRMKGCSSCGYKDNTAALQFDHIDPATKLKPGGKAIDYSWSISKIKREVKKCRVLCATCHAETLKRKQLDLSSPETSSRPLGPRGFCQLCEKPTTQRTVTNKYGRQYKYYRPLCSQCEYKRYRKNEV